MKRSLVFLILLSAWACGAMQEEDVTKLPGYVDLSQFLHKDKDLITEVEISNPLLSLVAGATAQEDAELSRMLQVIKLIKVYSFDVKPNEMAALNERIQSADAGLIKAHWERFVKVREGKELTTVYLKMDQKQVVGLALLSVDEKEAAFINIVGAIDLKAMNRLGEKFNIPKLDSLSSSGNKP